MNEIATQITFAMTSTKFLIVNADDFGLCAEITTGIVKAHTDGIVTATSIVANGEYLNEGIKLLNDNRLDAGIHLTFVGGEKPLTGRITGITDDNGNFRKSYREILPNLITGQFDRAALKKELYAQFALLKDSGVQPSHIDSHQHLHLMPSVRNMTIELAKHFGIKWVRLTTSGAEGLKNMALNLLSGQMKLRLRKEKIGSADSFIGFRQRGRIDERSLFLMMRRVKEGVTELMVHPGYDASEIYGWGYRWTDELAALTSPDIKKLLRDLEIRLTNFVSS